MGCIPYIPKIGCILNLLVLGPLCIYDYLSKSRQDQEEGVSKPQKVPGIKNVTHVDYENYSEIHLRSFHYMSAIQLAAYSK